MNEINKNDQRRKLPSYSFVIGGLSFVPLIGVFFGVVAIVLGLIFWKAGGWKLLVVGVAGITLTVVLYGALFYMGVVQRGGPFDEIRSEMAEGMLVDVVHAIEFYKLQNGTYPDSLEVLRKSLPENSYVFVFDPTDMKMKGQARKFYYEVVDPDHYYLLGVGPDGQPFTDDDLLPALETNPGGTIGLLTKPR